MQLTPLQPVLIGVLVVKRVCYIAPLEYLDCDAEYRIILSKGRKEEYFMSAENKAVVRRLFQEVWNRGHIEVADEIVVPDYVDHTRPAEGLAPGVRGFKQQVSLVHATLAGFRIILGPDRRRG